MFGAYFVHKIATKPNFHMESKELVLSSGLSIIGNPVGSCRVERGKVGNWMESGECEGLDNGRIGFERERPKKGVIRTDCSHPILC